MQLWLICVINFFSGYFNVSNVQLTGLSTIVASQISLSILSLALTMTIQTGTINLNLNYDGDAVIANLIPLYGAGKAKYIKTIKYETVF